jgi:hypothetical protein
MIIRSVSSAANECDGKLVCQNFEGTGYDNSESWSEVDSPDEDYTTTVLRGSQSLDISGDTYESTTITFSATGPCYVFFRFRFSALPSSDASIFIMRDASDNQLAALRLRSNGYIRAYNGTGGYENSGGTYSANTTYYVWLEYTAGSGADGETKVYIDTDTTKPAATITVSDGDATTDATKVVLTNGNDGTPNFVFDQILVDDEAISDVDS